MSNIEEIIERAEGIKNEVKPRANTADRVGSVLVDVAEFTKEAALSISDSVSKSIKNIETKQSSEDGGENVVTIEQVNGDKKIFVVRNGSKGSQGAQGEQGLKGEPFTYNDFTEEEIKELQKPATDAATKAKEVLKKAETATTGAETCNVTIQGSTISVTNRNGETKSVDVINTDEEVTVTIASSVESINVAGIKINVFLNNGKTPQSYTTNAEGKATFTIDRGNYYQVVFPEYGNAQPIAPVGYTSVLGSRNINVEYLPYDEDSMEKVIITATKYVENVGTAWEGIPVIVTIDRKDTTYQTDAKGQVTVFVPYKKEYTVVINDQDGYNVSFNKNSRTYTANVPQRLIDYRFYQFKAGIFVVDIDKNEYYIEDWVAAGRNADDAVAIKVADASLSINHGTFCIRTSDIKNVAKLVSMQWCTQNLQFNSIALNGNNVNDANYYNGESSTYLIRQEAQERSLSVPAFDYAYGQIFNIGGEDLHGFVMSVGQEYVHVANIGIIKQVLETLYGETVATAYNEAVSKACAALDMIRRINESWTERDERIHEYILLMSEVNSRINLLTDAEFLDKKQATNLNHLAEKVLREAYGWQKAEQKRKGESREAVCNTMVPSLM